MNRDKEKYLKVLSEKGYSHYQPYVDTDSYHAYPYGKLGGSRVYIHFGKDEIHVSLHGHGGGPGLIAKNEQEFIEAVDIWFRNR